MSPEPAKCSSMPWEILAGALLLRLAAPLAAWYVAGEQPLVREPDSAGYLEAAHALWKDGEFTRGGMPEIVRTPGYPLLLVPGVAWGRVDLWAILLQAMCGTATVFVVMRLAAETALDVGVPALAAPPPKRANLAQAAPAMAGLAAACDPMAVLYCGKVLSETCFSMALAICLWGLVRHAIMQRWVPLVSAALALAIATFVRPISFYLPPLVAIWLVWARRLNDAQAGIKTRTALRGANVAGRCLHAAIFLLLAMGPSLLWQLRNYRAAGYAGFSAITDVNLYYWQAAPVVAEQERISLVDAQARLAERERLAQLPTEPRQHAQAARLLWMRREALHTLRQAPWLYARIHLMGMLAVVSDPGTRAWLDYVRYQPPARPAGQHGLGWLAWTLTTKPWAASLHALLWGWILALLVLGALGLYRMPRSASWWLFVLVFLYLWCLSGGPLGYHRFRIPLLVVWCVWVGHGLAVVARRRDLR